MDIAVAVAISLYATLEALSGSAYPGPAGLAAALVGGSGLAVAFRRRAPVAAFCGSMGLLVVAAVVVGPFQTGGSILIAVVACYSGMAYGVSWALYLPVVLAFSVVDNTGPLEAMLSGAAFVLALLAISGYGGWLTRRLRETSAANMALRELAEQQAEALAGAAVDRERGRVARELHDILSHSLGVVALQTGAAQHAWESDPDGARAAVTTAHETAVKAVEQLRTLLSVVREDDPSDRRPIPTLDDLPELTRQATAAGFRVDLAIDGDPRPLSPQVQASIYRITQEGIANSLRHSGASSCAVRIRYEADAVVIAVEDEGLGSPGATPGSSLGLVGVRERVGLLGGRVDVGPRPRGGWRLEVAIPA